MKLLNGTVVHNATDHTSHIRLYMSPNGEYTDNGHLPMDLVIKKGDSKETVAAGLRRLADRIEAL